MTDNKNLSQEELIKLDKIEAELLTGVPYPLQRVLDAVGDCDEIGEHKYKAHCVMPEHPDNNPSMQIEYNPESKKVLLKCWSCGAKYEDLLAAMSLNPADLQIPVLEGRQEEECYYDYCDERGKFLYQRVRYKNPKGFKCRRPNPDPNSKDEWIWELGDVRRVPYRLPELLEARTPFVFIVEGEKDVETLMELGFVATTSGGAKTWRTGFAEYVRGRKVIIIPDKDPSGAIYINAVVNDLLGIAASVDRLDLSHGKDISDYLKLLPEGSNPKGMVDFLIKNNLSRINSKARVTAEAIWMDTAKAKKIDYLWSYRLALGKFTLLAGDADVGKSMLSLYIASHVSTGTEWPDGRGKPEIGTSLIFGVEDDTEDTILPRLKAMNAELSRIAHMVNVFTIEEMITAVKEQAKTRDDIKLVIIDPINSFMGGGDTYKDSDVRRVLAPLIEFAREQHFAILALTHYSKSEKSNASYKITGSQAFNAIARQVWHCMRDGTRTLFLPGKANVVNNEYKTGLAYTVVEAVGGKGIKTGKVEISPEVIHETADEFLRRLNQTQRPRDKAIEWLEIQLINGPVESGELKRRALEAGHLERTLFRAKKDLGAKSRPIGKNKTEWYLPGD